MRPFCLIFAIVRSKGIALATLIAVLTASCATVEITSEPRDAEVFILRPGQNSGKSLGKTPYQGKLSEIVGMAGEGPIILQLRKAGFMPQSIFVPNISGSDLKVSTIMPSSSTETYPDINRVVRLALRAEREILEKRFDAAVASAQEIRKINENATSSYEIEGAVYLLKGDLEKSLASWRKSLAISPDNADATGMVNLIEAKLGRKTPRS